MRNRNSLPRFIIGTAWGSAVLCAGVWVCTFGFQSPLQSSSSSTASGPQASNTTPFASQNTIRVEVPIVTVDVVVTDKKDKPVRGLSKADFKIFEDGIPQEITNFEYMSEEDPAGQLASITTDRPLVPEQQNYLMFLFDNTSMDSPSQEHARQAAAKFIDENLRPSDFVAIANYRNSMQIVQNFSNNKRRLARALGVIVGPEGSDVQNSTGDLSANSTFSRAQQNLQSLGAGFDARNLMIAMRGLFSSLRNIKGRKSLVVFSGGLTLSIDNSIDLYSAIDAANKANVTVYTIDAKGLNVDFPTNVPGQRRTSFNFPTTPPSLGIFMSAFQGAGPRGGAPGGEGLRGGGGTSVGPPGGGRTGGGAAGGFPSGNPGGNPGNSPGGTTRNNPYGGNPYSNNPYNNRDPYASRDPLDRRLDQLSLSELKDVLLSMAVETGGFYIRNSNDFNRGLQSIKSEMRNFYSLGYESNNKVHDGKFRGIKVEVQKKGVHVKYRKGYFDQKSLDALAGTPAEKPLNKAIDETAPLTALPLQLTCDYFYEGAGQARAPIAVQLPIFKLKFKKEKNIRSDAIDVLGVAFRENGTKAARFSDTVNFKIDNDRLKKMPENATLTIPNYFKLEPGKYKLKVAVHEEGDLIGTVEQPLDIPPYSGSQFATSSLVLSDEVRQVSSLITILESELLDDKNPLITNGMKVYQSAAKKFYKDRPLALYFTVYNLSLEPKQQKPVMLLSYSILAEDKIVYQMPLSRVTELPKVENGALPMGVWISLKDLNPGRYTLQMMVRDGVTNANRFIRGQFEVTAPPQNP